MLHTSTIKKVAIIFVLVFFLLSTGLVSVLYLGSANTQTDTGSTDAIPSTEISGSTSASSETIAPGSILNAFGSGKK